MPESKQNTISIPESVTINGVTYLVSETPELQKFIQDVSKVEKSKLYSQFESLKAQIKDLSGVHVTEDEQKQQFDIKALVESLKDSFVTKEDLKESLKSTVEEVVRPVLDATKKTQEDEINAYREKLITENAATCIPELVKGNTKEELDAALKESIRLRAAYPSPGNEQKPYSGDPNIQKQAQQPGFQAEPAKSPTPNGQQQAPAAPPAPHRPAADASQEPTATKTMPMSEFAQKRDALKQQLEAMYGNGGTL
jgi:hypothetical protein